MALTKIKTGGLANNAVTDAKVADAITVTGAQTGITQVGTLTAGTWQGTAIASAYLDADTAHLTTTQTFTGTKTFQSEHTYLENTGGNCNLFIKSSNSGNARLYLGDVADAGAGFVDYDNGTNMTIGTEGAVALTIDSSQNATFSGSLEISHATTPDFTLNDTGGTTNKRVFRISGGGDAVYFEGRNNDNSGDGSAGTIQTLSLDDGTVTYSGDLRFGNNPTSLFMDTNDGNDDKKLQMCGGGGVSTDRGATIIMHGNEIANNEGCLDLKAGWKSDEGDIRFFTGNNDERGRINYAGGLGIKGAFVNSASSDPADYQISFGGDAVTTPRWGFRVSGSSNEDLYLDRNLSGTPAIAMTWNKGNGNTTIKGKLTVEVENETPLHIRNTSTAGGNNAYLTIENDGGADTYLNFLQGSSNGYIKYTDEGDMIFQTAGMNDRLKLDSDMALFSSHVNIGSDSTTQWEHTSGDGSFHYHKGGVDTRNAGISMSTDSSVGYAMFYLNMIDGANDERVFAFYRNDSQIGAVRLHGTTEVTYDTTSDYRLKENIEPMTGSIARLKQIKPSTFNFISEPDRSCEGFIAHELAGIVPNAVSGEKDAMRDDGKRISPQGVDSGKVVPLLVSALQEAIERIEVLENA